MSKQSEFSQEQINDIKDREKKALAYLKVANLTPAAIVQKVNVGNDMFVDKVVPYLQDTKYSGKGELPQDGAVPSVDPEVNPMANPKAIGEPKTDEPATDTK